MENLPQLVRPEKTGYRILIPFMNIGTGMPPYAPGEKYLDFKPTGELIPYTRLMQISPVFTVDWRDLEGAEILQKNKAISRASEFVLKRGGSHFCIEFKYDTNTSLGDNGHGYIQLDTREINNRLEVTPLHDSSKLLTRVLRDTLNIPPEVSDEGLLRTLRGYILDRSCVAP